MNKFFTCVITGLVLYITPSFSQINTTKTKAQQLITGEDSLQAGNNNNSTVISGYGSAFYQHNKNKEQALMNLERAVIFIGHRFNPKISLFTELELEDGKVEGGSGEIAFEQAYLRFNINPSSYVVAGLFVPRIGLINENHLPVNFNGVERPLVEQLVIPATWRELGVGYYGASRRLPLQYSVALMNGLNSAAFEHENGIRGGRYEGSNANATSLAVTGSVQYTVSDFKFQLSGYTGGSVGLNKREADSLGLSSGPFGTPVYLGEADVQYSHNAFGAKLLGTYISIPDAEKINTAYGKNTASGMYGAYAELSYDWLYNKHKQAQFISFTRYELIDLNSSTPTPPKAIYDGTLKQSHFIAGFSYLPIPNVVIKADVRIMNTGDENPALVVNPAPNALPYQSNNRFINVGIGYSF